MISIISHNSTIGSIDKTMEDKNMEQANPKPEESEGKKIQIIKETEEVKMEERRTMRPKKTRITKELIEMTRGGLINMINLPIVNREEGIFRKEYRRSFMTVSYTHLDVYKRQK